MLAVIRISFDGMTWIEIGLDLTWFLVCSERKGYQEKNGETETSRNITS
jgi:hypothetical protein